MRAALVFALLHAARAQQLPPAPPLEPNGLAGVVGALREFAAASPAITPTGLSRASMLETIAGIVDFFVPLQNATTGAIIDPNTHLEMEYATPCFSHAAATLAAHGGRADLVAPAAAALTCSIHELSSDNCATRSCDFFAVPVMRSLALLTPLVPAATVDGWVAGLRGISYASWEFTGQNWELTAAAGEYTRIVKLGYAAGTNLNWTLWESRIGRLANLHFWSAEGLFLDNTGNAGVVSPMAYDAFGSSYPAVLLNDGYSATGVYADFLGEIQARGLWSRAAYQSPCVSSRNAVSPAAPATATLTTLTQPYARLTTLNLQVWRAARRGAQQPAPVCRGQPRCRRGALRRQGARRRRRGKRVPAQARRRALSQVHPPLAAPRRRDSDYEELVFEFDAALWVGRCAPPPQWAARGEGCAAHATNDPPPPP